VSYFETTGKVGDETYTGLKEYFWRRALQISYIGLHTDQVDGLQWVSLMGKAPET
jgi:hypothetical protein